MKSNSFNYFVLYFGNISQLNSQKQLKSWTVLDKLSTPVVYDASSGYYVAIFGQKTLKYWDEAEVDLKKAKKIKVVLIK